MTNRIYIPSSDKLSKVTLYVGCAEVFSFHISPTQNCMAVIDRVEVHSVNEFFKLDYELLKKNVEFLTKYLDDYKDFIDAKGDEK